MKKCNLDEAAVIACYEKHENARIVAKEFGVSQETIYRVLKRNNIKRTHRHEKVAKGTLRPSNCRTSICRANIVMLRTVLAMRTVDIAKTLNVGYTTISNVIARYGLQVNKPTRAKDLDMDALEAEYLAGASTYELGEKYGVNHTTISKWMKQCGHVRGKGIGKKGKNKGHETQKQRAIEKLENKLIKDTGGSIVLVEFGGEKSTYRCTVCGSVFIRCRDSRGCVITCQTCFEKEISSRKEAREKERKKQQALREKEKAEELAKDKICESCGGVFHSESPNAKYCSDTCSRREKRHRDVAAGKMLLINSGNHRKRARIYGVAYEPGITVKKLVARDNNICQICGEPCDIHDHRWSEHFGPLYPTIDHIIAMANGGGHTWDNVQLAHAICNSIKRDLTEEELTEEVITHAKEQAIAHKCA